MLFPKSWGLDSTATVQFPLAVNIVAYIIIWAVVLAGLFFIYRRSRGMGFGRWTTQDILVVAILGVLLEVYDNLIGDQFITPIIQLIPLGHAFALNDLPYMFLLMVGVALIRKPGAATAMVFLNFLLMQLFYNGSGVSIPAWPYGLLQGLFVDLYFVFRGTAIFANGTRQARVFATGDFRSVVDGLFMGILRAVPAIIVQDAFLQPFLLGETRTVGYIFFYALFNLIGNGVEAAVMAPLAVRIARSVNPSAGIVREPAPITTQVQEGA